MNISARTSTHTIGDYAYDAIYVGGIGGGIVALFYLVFDIVVHGEPLFTPSLMGSVLFDGVRPAAVIGVNMMAVAKYSAVHFLAFGTLGLFISFITHQAEIRYKHPLMVIGFVFIVIEAAFWLGTTIVAPGVLARLGAVPVAVANLLAAVGIASFLVFTHRPELWLRVRRALHLAPPASGDLLGAGRR
jgi:hypothetical protein